MSLVCSISGLFKWRQFEPEVILLAVGWYLRFSLSYRHVEELLAERGISVDHVTLWRWVAEVRARVGAASAQTAQSHQRLLARGRDLRPREGPMALLVPGRGLPRGDAGFSAVGQAGRRGSEALPGQSLGSTEPPWCHLQLNRIATHLEADFAFES